MVDRLEEGSELDNKYNNPLPVPESNLSFTYWYANYDAPSGWYVDAAAAAVQSNWADIETIVKNVLKLSPDSVATPPPSP